MKNFLYTFLVGIIFGSTFVFILMQNSEVSVKDTSRLGNQLEAWRIKAHNLGIEVEAALDSAAFHKSKADSIQLVLTRIRTAIPRVNFIDSSDFQILKGFDSAFGSGVGRKIPVPRDQLAKALNSIDSLKQSREEIKQMENIIYHLEGNSEKLHEAIDDLEQKSAVLDTALSACIENRYQIKVDNERLQAEVTEQRSAKNRWKAVSFVSMILNGIQAWLR